MLNNKIPLISNGISIHMIEEHQGEIFFSKWNPFKRLLATGGAGDYFVNVWDYNQISAGSNIATLVSPALPVLWLRHISKKKTD
jgi:hypothetical protein